MDREQKKARKLRRVTLNCSGGIALGAFMAGVFFELIEEALEKKTIAIDIITGASAGAMTGAIASYYLLKGDRSLFDRVETNAFYEAWVEKSDMENIDTIEAIRTVEEGSQDKQNLSLLSSKAIEEIAQLIAQPPTQIDQPLALLMTVTNLQGLIIQDPSETQNNIKSLTCAETREFLFHSGLLQKTDSSSLASLWNKVIVSSLASGAYPVAFKPIQDASSPDSPNFQYLIRDYFRKAGNWKEFNPDFLPNMTSEGKLKFFYSDGGILDNLPILKAIDLEMAIRGKSSRGDRPESEDRRKFKEEFEAIEGDSSNRLYVYIDPNPTPNLGSQFNQLGKKSFSLLEMAFKSLAIPQGEHEATQLKQVIEINQKVALKKQLLKKLQDKNLDNDKFAEIEEFLEDAIPFDRINLSPITPLIINSIGRSASATRLGKLKPIYEALIFNYPQIQDGLQEECADKLLASDFLGAFGGFFDRQYREHDFLLGRICGLTWIYQHFDIEETERTQNKIDDILTKIPQHILKENPRYKDMKLSYKIRLFRIAARALRIVTLQIETKNNFWQLLSFPLVSFAILLTRGIEGILTLLLWIVKAFE